MGGFNPLAMLMGQRAMNGPGGPPMGGPTGPAGVDPGASGQAVASQLAELRGADPDAISKILAQLHSQVVSLIPQTALRIPKVADNLTGAMKSLAKAMEAAKEAQNILSSVGGGLGTSAVSSSPSGGPSGSRPPMGGPGIAGIMGA